VKDDDCSEAIEATYQRFTRLELVAQALANYRLAEKLDVEAQRKNAIIDRLIDDLRRSEAMARMR